MTDNFMELSLLAEYPGGGLLCKKVKDAHWKIWLEPLKETNLGML